MNKREGKTKVRLDIFLVENELVPNRSKARGEIMAGNVYVDNIKQDKPGFAVSCKSKVEIRGKSNPYVSRGGLKLEKALQSFSLSLTGKMVLDIGASTGGFTDCALQHGAAGVIALDVGYGQLDWSLRNHPRVVIMERFNVRHLQKQQLPFKPQVAAVDVSFISLELVLPVLFSLEIAQVIALVKPQFEASPERVGKRGVVKDINTHKEILEKIVDISVKHNYIARDLTYSPIKGPQGNIEYLVYLEKPSSGASDAASREAMFFLFIENVVEEAHRKLY